MVHRQRSNRVKHFPVRTCVICRQTENKRELIRLVRTLDGIQIDLSGKAAGRGAYLCRSLDCWQQAVKTNALNIGLRTTLTDRDRVQIEAYSKSL